MTAWWRRTTYLRRWVDFLPRCWGCKRTSTIRWSTTSRCVTHGSASASPMVAESKWIAPALGSKAEIVPLFVELGRIGVAGFRRLELLGCGRSVTEFQLI